MRRFILWGSTFSLLITLLFIPGAYSQVKVTPPPVNDPQPAPTPFAKVILSGPTETVRGRQIIISTTGTFGDDYKFSVYPDNKYWRPYRSLDDPNVIELVFTPQSDGNYVFFLGVNKDGKTAIGQHIVQVGNLPNPPPDPGPNPDPDLSKLFTDIQAAYTKDNKPAEKKAYLIALYQKVAKEPNLTNVKLLQDFLSKSTAETFNNDINILRNTRDVVADYLVSKFRTEPGKPIPPGTPVDPKLQDQWLTNVVNALQKAQ